MDPITYILAVTAISAVLFDFMALIASWAGLD